MATLSLSLSLGDRAGPALTPRASAQPRFIGGLTYPGGGLPPPGSAEQKGKIPRLTRKQLDKRDNKVCKLRFRPSAAVGDIGAPGQKLAFPASLAEKIMAIPLFRTKTELGLGCNPPEFAPKVQVS